MELGKLVQIKISFIFFLLFYLTSCDNKTKEEKWKMKAINAYHDFRMWEDGAMMNNVDFRGPVLCKKSQLKGIKKDSTSIIYGWFYTHNSDTVWIYCNVYKKRNIKPSMHTSPNYEELGLHWREWLKK